MRSCVVTTDVAHTSEVLCCYYWCSTIMFTRYMYNKILQLGYTQFRHTIAHLQGHDMYLSIVQIMILIVALLLPHSILCIVIMFHAVMRFDHTETSACPVTVMDRFKWKNMESILLTAISTSITLWISWGSYLGFIWNIIHTFNAWASHWEDSAHQAWAAANLLAGCPSAKDAVHA